MAVLSFDISGSQIDGARDYQEDAFLITHLGDKNGDGGGSMVIVADGMGGHAAGNVASNMAVQTFNRHVSKHFPSNDLPAVLHEAVLQANQSIAATVAETAALKGMGCTLVACVLDRDGLHWASVGDSHLYLLRNGELVKRNADHSYGGFLDRMAEAGTPVEAESGFSRNMLMSALTGDDIAEIDCPDAPLMLRAGDRVLLASDGLDTLAREEIAALCAASATPRQCVEALLEGVVAAGAPRQDNTTVIVVDVTEQAEPELAPPVPLTLSPAAEPAAASAAPAAPAAPRHDLPVVDDTPERSGRGGLIAAVVVLLLAAGGGGWWFLQQGATPAAPAAAGSDGAEAAAEPATPAEDELVELEPVENPPPVAGTVGQAAPATPAAPAPAAVPSGTFRDGLRGGGQGPLMIWVPAGQFKMGNYLTSGDPDEQPQHDVSLPGFAIGVNEVTVAEYRQFARATGRKMPPLPPISDEREFPITFVSWDDALAYTQWLSGQTGKQYGLPTEAQWEYAARGGAGTAYWWGRDIGRGNAHCFACETGLDPRLPTAIGRFAANKFGLYDTAGNAEEWVHDCYHPDYFGAPGDGSVFEGGDCTSRVLRGGGYGSGPNALRSSHRDKLRADKGNDQTGFRVVRKP